MINNSRKKSERRSTIALRFLQCKAFLTKIISITQDTVIGFESHIAYILNGGGFNIADNMTLTIKKPILAGNYQIFFGNGNVVLADAEIIARPEWVGGGLSVSDNLPAFQKLASLQAKAFLFQPGTYVFVGSNAKCDNAVMKFIEQDNLVFIGNGTKLQNKTHYALDDKIHAIFEFQSCNNVRFEGSWEYEGQDPWVDKIDDSETKTGIGYVGESFIYVHTGSRGLHFSGKIKGARYGILSGNYSNSKLGRCADIFVNIKTKYVGYPVAVYLVDNLNVYVTSEDAHRSVYAAGVHGGNIFSMSKNQHIASIQVLLTDAYVRGFNLNGVSRGCSNIDVISVDLGSQFYVSNSWMAGISLSRVDPNTKFENLHFIVRVIASDTVSSNLGGFSISSGAKSFQPSYPHNWENTICLRNITISGLIDRSAQTIPGHKWGDLYIRDYDIDKNTNEAHAGILKNVGAKNLIIKGGSGSNSNAVYLDSRGVNSSFFFRDCDFSTVDCIMMASSTARIEIYNSKLKSP